MKNCNINKKNIDDFFSQFKKNIIPNICYINTIRDNYQTKFPILKIKMFTNIFIFIKIFHIYNKNLICII